MPLQAAYPDNKPVREKNREEHAAELMVKSAAELQAATDEAQAAEKRLTAAREQYASARTEIGEVFPATQGCRDYAIVQSGSNRYP